MPRALNLLRASPHYRREAFDVGLRAAGFKIVSAIPDPRPGDLLVSWNLYAGAAEQAWNFRRHGATVLVVENGYLGKVWRGAEWFSLALDHHAGAGRWVDGGPARWDSWGVELAPWRTGGLETVILGQRGIGECGIASPHRWAEGVQRRIGGRIRQHPGQGPAVPLADDLRRAREVVTWHSGAALHALLMGIPVWCDFPQWIGAGAALPLSQYGAPAMRDDAARLAMFRRMAWAQWTLEEVRTGEPIARLAHAG